jgi:hypothetical protein
VADDLLTDISRRFLINSFFAVVEITIGSTIDQCVTVALTDGILLHPQHSLPPQDFTP